MKFRKIVTYLMMASLVIAPYGAHSIVHAEVKEAAEEKDQNEILDQVLVKVKNVITIPKDYSEFSYSYNNYSEDPSWYLSWSRKDGNGSIDISCDNDAHIGTYNLYDYTRETNTPDYLRSELKEKAENFLRKAAKDEYSNLTYLTAYYSGVYNNRYSFVYERTENGIPVPDNQMTVSVNAKTGKVEQFDSSWNYKAKMPSGSAKISKETATKVLRKELKMNLEYHSQPSEDGKSMKTKLLYVPNKLYLAVDALNGKVYDKRENDIYYGAKNAAECADAGATMAAAGMDRDVLTEEEIAKIKELSGLLSKKDAIAALKKNKLLYIDSDATSQNAVLCQTALDRSDPEKLSYIWKITLSDPHPADYSGDLNYDPHLTASVDAKTGQVIDFDASCKSYNYGVDTSSYIKFTEEEGRNKAESFLKKNYKNIFDQTQYTDVSDGYVISYSDADTNYGGKIYTFTRVCNGIPCPENQITVGVDLVTGKINSFYYTWYDNVTFDAPSNVITADAAADKYFACDGYELVYEINQHYDNDKLKQEIRLVYRTDINPAYFDAVSGDQVNCDGTAMTSPSGFSYSDINGSVYKRTILILADMGIGFNTTLFQPNEAITREQFNQLVQCVDLYDVMSSSLAGTGTITREDAAKYAIKTLKLDYIAKLDVFKSLYKDSDSITPGDMGYVVLADQLGIVTASKEGEFRPKDALTRGEAAQLILQMITNYQYN